MITRFEKVLPAEQWQQILKNVPPGDLCKVATTSKYMNGLASWPKLWTGMTVNVRKVRDDGLAKFYSIDRFKRVSKINFTNVRFTLEQLERLLNDMEGSPLENINFGSDKDFSEIPAEVLGSALGQLQTFKLSNRNHRLLTTDQCVKILEAIVSSRTLVNVTLENQLLCEVPSQLLAGAVTRLQSVDFNESYLTTDQCIEILNASLSSATLVKVNLSLVDLTVVPTQLLVKAVCRLKTINLCCSDLTSYQILHLLEGMVSSSTLVRANLEGLDLDEVPSWLLSKAVTRLQAVNLCGTQLTTHQTIELLKATLSSATLTKLKLISVNLSEVPADLLSRIVCRLSAAELGDMFDEDCMPFLHCSQILEAIATSSKLVKLSLYGVDLSQGSSEILSNAVHGLQTIKLNGAYLTTEQCIAFLEATVASETTVHVYLPSVNLSEVPAGLLVRAVCKLKTFHLANTRLTLDQCVQLVNALISSGTVCWTYLRGNDITEKVPAHKLASLPPHVSGCNCGEKDGEATPVGTRVSYCVPCWNRTRPG